MKKILVAGAVAFSICVPLHAITYTNKSFMNTPSPHYYLPMQITTWHRLLKQGSSDHNPWGGTVQLAAFYHASTNEGGLGEYFGTNNKNEIKINLPAQGIDVQNSLLFHNSAGASTLTTKGALTLRPEHISYGAYLSYNQDLFRIHNGLFLRLNLPLTHVENNPHAGVSNETVWTANNKRYGILDFFSGSTKPYELDEDKQDPLTHAKIDGPRNKTGVADLQLLFGYKFTEKPDYQMSGNLTLMIPTGNEPSGEYLFEPRVGTNHWGLGAALDASMVLQKSAASSFEFLTRVEFMYLFKADEHRTLGYRSALAWFDDRAVPPIEDIAIYAPWAHYFLTGQQGKAGCFPFANVLTREVDVRPGSILQGHATFAYHRSNTTVDFGYSFFSQEGEEISVKSWKDSTYGPADPTYKASEQFSVTDPAMCYGGPVNNSELDPQMAATPTVLKHSVFAALGYTISEWKNPFAMGAGFSVDWTEDNATPVGYTLWLKAGASF